MYEEFFSINNVLREYNEMKKEIKNPVKKYFEIYYIKMIERYWVSCEKNTVKKNSTVRKTKQYRLMILSNCISCGKKRSRFIKNQESIM